jgi:hypothetical protein
MDLGVLQACMRAWRTHSPSSLPDFVEICIKESCMVTKVCTLCNIKHINTQMYSSAARVRVGESGQDQEEQGPLDMSDSYRLNSPKPRCVVHIPKNRRESYIRFQGLACAPEKGCSCCGAG